MEKAFEDFLVSKSDKQHLNDFIIPKLNRKEKVNLLFSLTYAAPSYYSIFKLSKLSLLPENFTINILVWDSNATTHMNLKTRGLLGEENASKYMEKRLLEMGRLVVSFGIGAERIRIFKSTEVWHRIMKLKDEKLISDFMHITGLVDQDRFNRKILKDVKFSRIIQAVTELFFVKYCKELFPESFSKAIRACLISGDRQPLYERARGIMQSEGMLKENLLFLLYDSIPIIEFNSIMPEWNMGQDEITDIIFKANPSAGEIHSICNNFLRNYLPDFAIVEQSGIKKADAVVFLNRLPQMQLKEAQASLAFNLKAFLDKMRYKSEKVELEKQTILSIKRIDSKEEAYAIGRVLKNHLLLNILLLADGSRNTTAIAKQLGKHIANVSAAISELKRIGLVTNGDGHIRRTQQAIAINLQCGLR